MSQPGWRNWCTTIANTHNFGNFAYGPPQIQPTQANADKRLANSPTPA